MRRGMRRDEGDQEADAARWVDLHGHKRCGTGQLAVGGWQYTAGPWGAQVGVAEHGASKQAADRPCTTRWPQALTSKVRSR